MHANPLDKYLRSSGESGRDLAKRAKVHYSRISRYRSGESVPMPDVADAIERATGGKVPAAYWSKRAKLRRKRRADSVPVAA